MFKLGCANAFMYARVVYKVGKTKGNITHLGCANIFMYTRVVYKVGKTQRKYNSYTNPAS
jgi:hypothetical protein